MYRIDLARAQIEHWHGTGIYSNVVIDHVLVVGICDQGSFTEACFAAQHSQIPFDS